VNTELHSWFEEIDNGIEIDCKRQIGYLKIAFSWAFIYLKRGESYENAMRHILEMDGDTDTNAAIVGGLLGAAG
jgi:ADP-ribosyl-[dinitrogen reductase] hydrolase